MTQPPPSATTTTTTPPRGTTRWLDLLAADRARGDLGGGIARLARLAAAAHRHEVARRGTSAPLTPHAEVTR